MMNVAHKIVLGGSTLESGKGSRLLELETGSELAVPVDRCRIELDTVEGVGVDPGAEVKLDLGYGKSLSRVFTGTVAQVSLAIGRITVEALGSFAALTSDRYNRVYEKQTAADIVNDLLGRAGTPKGTVEDGVKFETFVVSDRESAWEVLHGLARRCGFDFYAASDSKAMFRKYAPQAAHPFSYGADILEYAQDRFNPLDGVEVYGESPAGQGQGDDASSWLTKKTVKGSAGKTSGRVLRIVDPAATSPGLARTIAGKIFEAQKVKARGRMRVIGAPDVSLGDAVRLSKMPDSSLNGDFKVTGVRHRLNAAAGFITGIDWEKV